MRRALTVVLLPLLLSCSGGTTAPDGTALSFSVLPIPIGSGLKVIISRGNVAPPDHTLPTGHLYFYTIDFSRCPCGPPAPLALLAPAGGVISELAPVGIDARIVVRVSSTISYYLEHFIPDFSVSVGDTLVAGDTLGVLFPNNYALGFGVVNLAVTHKGLLAPGRYPDVILHSDGPLQYFQQPLRDQLVALVRRNAADFDGKVDFDEAGKLVGSWFLQGVPNNETAAGAQNGARQLAFVYDVIEPTQVRVAIGGTIDLSGVWALAPGDPLPVSVTPASGIVLFHLQDTKTGADHGRLLVRLLDSGTLRAEKFPPGTGALTFDVNAKIYVR